jgi:uncharacterized membrane protein
MTTTEPSTPRVSWPHVVLAVLGGAISCYAIYAHILIKRGEDAGCSISETISCDKVLASRYGELFGIPLGVYGLIFFAIVLLTAIITNPRTTPRQAAAQRLIVTAIGLLVSAALTYISIAFIGAECPICLSTHATTLALFLISVWQYLRARRAPLAAA